MKSRSKPLQTFLANAGVLHGRSEEIARAKRAYRQRYKIQWRQHKRGSKELRVAFTVEQHTALSAMAQSMKMRLTPYARMILLSNVGQANIYTRHDLLSVLQLVSMAINEPRPNGHTRTSELLLKAETLLLGYLNIT